MENSCPSCGVCSAVDGELARKMRQQEHATTEEVFVESRKFEEGTFELMVNPWPTKEFATLFAERWEKKSDSRFVECRLSDAEGSLRWQL